MASISIKYSLRLFRLTICFLCCESLLLGQTASVHGQASAWLLSNPDIAPLSQIGLRYIPELTLGETIDSNLSAEMDLSLNSYAFGSFARNRSSEYSKDIKPYRAWLRLASNTFEVRAGLQKINFGSATLFRPLMWFDKIDPRDPLQLTDGVKGLLARYFFLNNTNIWFWGLYDNNDTKGLERTPTTNSSFEYGERFQLPIFDGEAGLSFHHRNTDIRAIEITLKSNGNTSIPEDRFGIDGKWDLGIGAWFEAVLTQTQTDIPGLKYQRQWTLGADYTFDIGNGLYILTEFFRSENPTEAFGRANGTSFSAVSTNYPIGIVDKISGIVYFDWTNQTWYRFINWQRTYDNWIIYLLGFWNPNTVQLYQTQSGSNTFAGTGIQLMVVFNH